MQEVIQINKDMLDWINDPNKFNNEYGLYDFIELIRNGTPLPENHGDLIDRNELLKQYGLENATKYGNKGAEQQKHSYSTMMMYEIADMIEDAETIIPATREKSCGTCYYYNVKKHECEKDNKFAVNCMIYDYKYWISKQTATKEGE